MNCLMFLSHACQEKRNKLCAVRKTVREANVTSTFLPQTRLTLLLQVVTSMDDPVSPPQAKRVSPLHSISCLPDQQTSATKTSITCFM